MSRQNMKLKMIPKGRMIDIKKQCFEAAYHKINSAQIESDTVWAEMIVHYMQILERKVIKDKIFDLADEEEKR